jgi:hypothetical protein
MTTRWNAVENTDKRSRLFVFCPFSLEENETKDKMSFVMESM